MFKTNARRLEWNWRPCQWPWQQAARTVKTTNTKRNGEDMKTKEPMNHLEAWLLRATFPVGMVSSSMVVWGRLSQERDWLFDDVKLANTGVQQMHGFCEVWCKLVIVIAVTFGWWYGRWIKSWTSWDGQKQSLMVYLLHHYQLQYFVPQRQIPWLHFALRASRLFGVKHFAGQVFYEVVWPAVGGCWMISWSETPQVLWQSRNSQVCNASWHKRACSPFSLSLSVYKSMQQMNIKTDELTNTQESHRYTVDN